MAQTLTAEEKNKTRDLVILENKVISETERLNSLKKQSDLLDAQITKKRTEYELFINQRDAETKQDRAKVLEEQRKLESDKAEFVKRLQDYQTQKSAFDVERSDFEREKRTVQQTRENLQGCIVSIQRAITLIGL